MANINIRLFRKSGIFRDGQESSNFTGKLKELFGFLLIHRESLQPRKTGDNAVGRLFDFTGKTVPAQDDQGTQDYAGR